MTTSRALHAISGTWGPSTPILEFSTYPQGFRPSLRMINGGGRGDAFSWAKRGDGYVFIMTGHGIYSERFGTGWGSGDGSGESLER